MGDKDDAGRSRPRDLQAQALARETGITFEQALELIQLIGPDPIIIAARSENPKEPETGMRTMTELAALGPGQHLIVASCKGRSASFLHRPSN
ncbi:hypothetical protein [Mesorhizobium sp. STM 4661]|uniref:hypothetical protein n=1 Tax=Mesorhizobium sp. STM 4661 TaxID=1297570 RepID=UPI0005652407|nr:hypothetical protein [Mesorhizobium sp. STM 4661]